MFKNILICCTLSCFVVTGLDVGSPCQVNGTTGNCVPLYDCLTAKENFIKSGAIPPICSHGRVIIVCCSNESNTTTTSSSDSECDPITTLSTPEIGRKAWDKCLEYQERILRPCQDSLLRPGKLRGNECNRDTSAIFLTSEKAYESELPHMVLLGFNGIELNATSWACEGVIISETFVMTLAACTEHRHWGRVRYIRTNVLRISDPIKQSDIYNIVRIIRHPSYQAPGPQNDIALLEIEKEYDRSNKTIKSSIVFDRTAIPACLDVGNLPSYERALASGWDRLFNEDEELKKEFITKTEHSSCRDHALNYKEDIQMCYKKNEKTTSRYGYDRILQIEHIPCMYVVIGLESRRNHISGISYNRVSAYVPWIESIVWP